jgi:nucleoside 2-deoxyribosyltransferase
VTKRLDVVGGVYRERCRLPNNTEEILGSGGRAASVVAGLGFDVTLHTATDVGTAVAIANLGQVFHFSSVEANLTRSGQFQYDHALSTPIISLPIIPTSGLTVEVDAEDALVFGMLEGPVEVRAKRIVYDPQNPISPEPFRSRSPTSRIAYVLNASEAKKLAKVDDVLEAARTIVSEYGAEVVVIKRGPWGALVYENGRHERVPAFKTDLTSPIGSGDVFASVFAASWMGNDMSPLEAAMHASRAAALYVNSRVLPIAFEEITSANTFRFPEIDLIERPLIEGEYHVYLAGPFFNISQKWLVDESRLALRRMGLTIFSPLHDIGLGDACDVAPEDVKALRRSRAILALVDGLDAGTVFEVGFARSLEKPVIALAEATPDEPLKMMTGTGCDVVSDFVTALYRVAWAAQA